MLEAKHIVRSHHIEIQAPPDVVFPLFTPLGEKKWVEGWEPVAHYPPSGEATEGAVFTTRAEGEPVTVWAIVAFDAETRYANYLRVRPGSRVAWVQVRCEEAMSGTTRVQVTYTFTALSEEGNRYVSDFTEARYREYIDSWKDTIHRFLGVDRN
jgi:hypothetical protein